MNRAEAVREFVAATSGEVVSKLFVNGLVEQGQSQVGHTRLLSAADLADLRGVDATAHQLQQLVNKRCDVRVVVVGERIFPVAIYPTSEAARIDFRSDYRALRHEETELPAPV